ncbi:MAG: hypothetical protein JSU04_00110 [Bdellovibrionales bacterium]|nr:hypothetical protein [Bdellovibrionales bacterium]
METNIKPKYTLGNYPFLQFFAESQADSGTGESGNEQSTDQEGKNTGDVSDNPEQSNGSEGDKPNQNPNDGDKPGDNDDAEVFDKPYVESLRKENAKYRTRAKEEQTKFETFANDLKTFLEKNGVQLENTESKSLLDGLDGIINSSRQTVLNAELERVAAQHSIVDADILAKLVDTTALKFENGHYVGLEEQVKAIAEAKPYLVKQVADTKPPKGGQGTGGAPKKLTQNDVENMTPAQIAAALKNGELTHLL